MTPSASPPTERRAPDHRRALRRRAAPTGPRRISGPSGGRARAGAAGAASGRRPDASRAQGLPGRALAFVGGLPDHPLLDRIVRGRAWIPLLGLMLAGIVAMQVEVLKLGATMGRAIEQGTALQSRNELLRANVATLADDQRIEHLAAGMGMVMPTPEEVGFLSVRRGNASRAAASIHPPDSATFLSSLAALTASSSTATTPATSSSVTAPSTTVGSPAVQTTGAAMTTATSTSAPTIGAATAPATTGPTQTSTPVQTPAVTQTPAATQTPAPQSTTPVQPTTATGPADSTGGAAAASGG